MSGLLVSRVLGPHEKYPKSVKAGIPKLGKLKKGWQRLCIGDLFDEITRPVEMDDATVYDLVTVKRSRGGVIKRESLPGKKIAVKTQFYVKEGDFLISKRQIVHGACGFVPKELDDSIVSNEYAVLSFNGKASPEFVRFLMHTPYFQQTCFHSSIGVHVEKMIFKLDEWFNWKIDIPFPDEQQKIASFLTAIDEKINLLHQKHECLQNYKRGVMQKIFSQEIRFKHDDGSDFPDWEEKYFGDVFNERSEKGFQNNELLSVKKSGGIVKRSEIEGKNNASINRSNYKRVLPDDIAYNSMRMWQGASGLSKYEGIVSPAYTVIQCKDENHAEFFSYLFKYEPLVFVFRRNSQGLTSDTWNLKYPAFSKIKYLLPCSLNEQIKIANFFKALDQKIQAADNKMKQVEAFNKGLLQKMFV